jgi:hypothetical protein
LSNEALLQRIERLEAIEAVRQLKARYLNACDLKQVDVIRDCFAEGEVHIDYGVIGVFNHRDGLIGVFNDKGNHDFIVDQHHASNPEVIVHDSDFASATWALAFQQINTRDHLLTQLGGIYQDEYRRVDSEWKITRTVFKVTSTLVTQISAGAPEVLFAGATITDE